MTRRFKHCKVREHATVVRPISLGRKRGVGRREKRRKEDIAAEDVGGKGGRG